MKRIKSKDLLGLIPVAMVLTCVIIYYTKTAFLPFVGFLLFMMFATGSSDD